MPAHPPISDLTRDALTTLVELIKLQFNAAGVYVDLDSQCVIAAKQSERYKSRDWFKVLAGARAGLVQSACLAVLRIDILSDQHAYLIVHLRSIEQFSRESRRHLNCYTAIASSLLKQNHQLYTQQKRVAELKVTLEMADAGLFRALMRDEKFIADEIVANLLGLDDAHVLLSLDAGLANVSPEGRKMLLESADRVLKLGGKQRVVFQMQDGSWCSALFMRDTQTDTDGAIKGLIRGYTLNRQTELESEQHQAQLETLVKQLRASNRTDPLTGLANRIELNERLSVITRENSSAATWISMLVLDIDHFKSYNDNFGHDAGDAAIRQVASIIKHNIDPADLAVRFGGEEFCVLTPAPAIETGALAEKIRAAIEQAHWPARAVTVSIGVYSMPAAEFASDLLFKNADNALYQAKHSGRNCVRTFDLVKVR